MERLASRKLWVTVIAGILVTIGQEFGLDLDGSQLIALGLSVSAYVLGQAHVDGAKVEAEVAAGVDQLKQEANAIIALLTEKLASVQAANAAEEPNADPLRQG